MIALGSKSYPYLAVAQHYGIDYSEVLELVTKLEKNRIDLTRSVNEDWENATFVAFANERERRKQVSGVSSNG